MTPETPRPTATVIDFAAYKRARRADADRAAARATARHLLPTPSQAAHRRRMLDHLIQTARTRSTLIVPS